MPEKKNCQKLNSVFKTPLICIDSFFHCWDICIFLESIYKVFQSSEKPIPIKFKYLSNEKYDLYKSGVFQNLISDISSFLVQNTEMPPYALKTALRLLRFYTKILEKINYIFYSQNYRQNVIILSPFLDTLWNGQW